MKKLHYTKIGSSSQNPHQLSCTFDSVIGSSIMRHCDSNHHIVLKGQGSQSYYYHMVLTVTIETIAFWYIIIQLNHCGTDGNGMISDKFYCILCII